MPPDTDNACISCGACCACFRVSFYWTETDPQQGGLVPPELTEDLPPFFVCMKGTNTKRPRCIALLGEVGKQVGCSIYLNRPEPCREFGVHWQEGRLFSTSDDLARCNQARAAWHLPPLTETRAILQEPSIEGGFHPGSAPGD